MQKVSHGQKFGTALKADTWNAFIDAAEYVKAQRLSQGGRGENLSDETTSARNDSGVDIPRYGAVWLQSALVRGASSSWEVMVAKRPTCPFLSQIGIASEPIGDGVVGQVWTRGQHPALSDYQPSMTYARFALTQRDSFELRMHHGGWGVPVIAYYAVGLVMVSLPIVPPPTVRVRLTAAQANAIGMPYGAVTSSYFDAAFLSFPDSDLSAFNAYGLSVE